MPDGDITMGELSRNLTSLEARMSNRFDAMDRRLDGLQFVHKGTYDVQVRNLTERIEDLEDSKKWLARSMAVAFLVAFLAPILVAVVVTR